MWEYYKQNILHEMYLLTMGSKSYELILAESNIVG